MPIDLQFTKEYNPKQQQALELLTDPEKTRILAYGGGRCFHPDTVVITNKGKKKISEINKGDMILSHNFDSGRKEYRECVNRYEMKNRKRTIKVKLINGQEIIATEDHEFYIDGGWVSLKHILNGERNMATNSRV